HNLGLFPLHPASPYPKTSEITYLVKKGRQARGRAAAGFLAGSQASDFFAVLTDSPLDVKL
ncbi:MAG: hypothetical protein OXF23_06095, partial [Candidatus Dadabacteria bacterium]|nr:hypothetical protein [Candidatus Dadabacteria bacterium]